MDHGTLFLTHLGEAFTPNRLTQLVRDYVHAAKIDKAGACHLVRHTMATLMLEGGADIRFIGRGPQAPFTNLPGAPTIPRMATLNLKSLDPAELMPLPEVPESYGPRNEEEQRIYDLVMEGINSGPGKVYASVDEFAAEFRAQLRNRTPR